MNIYDIKIKEHQFTLSSRKTIFWHNKKTLLISDLHLGAGNNSETNFTEKIIEFKDAIKEFNPKRIIILGDLIDVKYKGNITSLKNLFSELSTEVILILGNHDVLDVQLYLNTGIYKIVSELVEDMFIFTHKPKINKKLNFHGHLHPAVKSKVNTKYACFYKDNNYFCLPAFGGLTGKHLVTPNKKEEIYMIENNNVKTVL